jgi:hypothetical protein
MTLRAEGLLIAPFLCCSEGANPAFPPLPGSFGVFLSLKICNSVSPGPDAVWETIQAKAINVVDNTT